jgi:hypothetical protein
LIQLTEHTIVKTKSILGFIDDLGRENNKGKLADNINAGEYMKELGQLKASLIGFASNIEHEELVQKSLDIPDLDFKDYEKIFSFSDHISSELDLLKNHLIEVDSILDICAIYLKAIL